MVNVILDTNSLLFCYERKLDIFSEVKRVVQGKVDFCVVDETIRELEGLAEKAEKQSLRQAAKLALVLIKQQNLKRLRGFPEKNADEAIMARAEEGDYVLTQDKELKARLKQNNIGILAVRSQDHIIIG